MSGANVAQEMEGGTSLYYNEAAVKVSLQYGLRLLPVKWPYARLYSAGLVPMS